jgi:hypothetical protein
MTLNRYSNVGAIHELPLRSIIGIIWIGYALNRQT